MYAGPAEAGEKALLPFRRLDEPLADFSGVMPYVEAQKVYDADYPAGHRYYWKSTNLDALSDDVVDVLVKHTAAAPSKHSTIDVWLNGGAMSRFPASHGTFRGGSTRYLVNPEANWEQPVDDDANVAWARGLLSALERHAADGAYLNFPGFLEEGGASLARRSHGSNYERLATLKRRLDPENVFRRNANIEPAV
jgi:FAD/FMN-containing dehydrogenase